MTHSLVFVCAAAVATASPAWARESMHLDEYLALIEHYRASDPVDSAQGRDLLLELPRWDIRETRRLADALCSLVQTEHAAATAMITRAYASPSRASLRKARQRSTTLSSPACSAPIPASVDLSSSSSLTAWIA
jgi:hypothetical protein